MTNKPGLTHKYATLTVIALLAGASIACNLTSQTNMTPATSTPVNTAVAQSGGITAPTLVSLATNIATVVPNSSTAVPIPSTACTVRTDWPVYTVAAGDTLASIAARTSSSIPELFAGNCLANADVIRVGQQLRIPVMPPPVSNNSGCTVRSDWQQYTVVKGDTLEFLAGFGQVSIQDLIKGNCWIDANDFFAGRQMRVPSIPGRDGSNLSPCSAVNEVAGAVGVVRASPSDIISPSCLHVRPGTVVTLTWTEAPPNLKRIEFWFIADPDPAQQFSGDPDVIAVDENGSDGISVNWTVYNQKVSGVIYAIGYPTVGKAINSQTMAYTTW